MLNLLLVGVIIIQIFCGLIGIGGIIAILIRASIRDKKGE